MESETKNHVVEIIDANFVKSMYLLADRAHQNAKAKGFWQADRNDGEMIALMHSELSELLEAHRHGDPPSEHIPEFTGREEEGADLLIRLMDYFVARNLRVPEAVIAKMEFNANRPYMHGKNF